VETVVAITLLVESPNPKTILARYGPLEHSIQEKKMVVPLRQLERRLFSAWCSWLCYPGTSDEDQRPRKLFEQTLQMVDGALQSSPGPFFLDSFSVVDCLFAPFLERMSASLFYYKGFTVRDASRFPGVAAWFDGMERRETYRGTQSDFHTHVHDLPPQLGGCYSNETERQAECQARVDGGLDLNLPDCGYSEPEESRALAALRVVKHKDYILRANPMEAELVEPALQCALTFLLTGEKVEPPAGSDVALRYIRDRVNVPRDMTIWAARRLREALEVTAAISGDGEGPVIPVKHRRDQDPRAFGK